MQISGGLSKYHMVPLAFAQPAVAANQTDVALHTTAVSGAAANNVSYTALWRGEIVAVSANVSTPAGAGTLTVTPTINGVAISAPILTVTTEAAKSAHSIRTKMTPFSAGAQLGAIVTTDNAWNGLASDLAVLLFVTQAIEGI